MVTKNTSIINNKFECIVCAFICSKKGDMTRHLMTAKHANMINVTKNSGVLHLKTSNHICSICSKKYNSRNGLWLHKKNCSVKTNAIDNHNIDNHNIMDSSNNEIKSLTSLVLELVKSNNEMQKQMVEVCSKMQPVNISNNNTTTNSHNKTFNLQFFLNEECKDAMNLQDFIESVQMQMADLETIGELGYVEGVSKFIMGKLNETDMNKRPVHCSDAKRETLYVKDDNVWTKEGAENVKIRGAVKKIEKKNIKLLNVWKEAHAGCMDSESPYNDQYTHMIIGSLGGCEPDNVNKVIKKIAKATIIDK